MALDGAARTHAGKVRSSNEDAWVCRPRAGLFAVIDGMGGEASGEVAAAVAAQAIAEVPDGPQLAGETILAESFRAARDRILAEADKDPEKEGMGAVATAIRFDDSGTGVSIAHVGDSRAYLVHSGGVRLLTHDHVMAPSAGRKRQVARDLGRRDLSGEWVETSRARVQRGDLLVLCSDGLHDSVAPDALSRELIRLRTEAKDADSVATRLIALALSAGAPDNVTVVAIRVGAFKRSVAGAWRGWVGPVVWLTAGLALGALAASRLAPAPDDAVPQQVGRTAVVDAARVEVPAATRTLVAPLASLQVRGVRVEGVDWTIESHGPVEIERSVLAVSSEVAVVLHPGAELLVRDVRVQSGRLRLVVPAGARARLEHLRLPSEAALVIEGPGAVQRQEITVSAPAGSAPSPGPP